MISIDASFYFPEPPCSASRHGGPSLGYARYACYIMSVEARVSPKIVTRMPLKQCAFLHTQARMHKHARKRYLQMYSCTQSFTHTHGRGGRRAKVLRRRAPLVPMARGCIHVCVCATVACCVYVSMCGCACASVCVCVCLCISGFSGWVCLENKMCERRSNTWQDGDGGRADSVAGDANRLMR